MAVQLQCRLVRRVVQVWVQVIPGQPIRFASLSVQKCHITCSDVHIQTVQWEVHRTDMRPFNVDFLLHMKQKESVVGLRKDETIGCFSLLWAHEFWVLVPPVVCHDWMRDQVGCVVQSVEPSVLGRRAFAVLCSACSWWVTNYVGKPSATGQPTRPTQPFILSWSINE